MVRKRAIDVTSGLKGKFHELPRRKMVQLDSDLTTDAPDDFSYDDVSDALVKIRIKHRRGDEDNANKMTASMISNCRQNKAYHIFRPELVVVGDTDTRMPELTVATKPMDAVRMWLKQRAPDTIDKKEVASRLEQLLGKVPDATTGREQFLPFVVRAIGGKNFQPFKGEFGIYKIPDGVFEIAGRYIDQEGRSNRAGKSAFLEVLLFVLTGRARKVKSLDKYIHKGQDSASGFLELIDHKGEQVRIDRTVKGNTTSVAINGQQYRVRDADEYIKQNVVGLSADDIVRTCIVQQNDLHGLLGQTSAEIQKDLVRWFGVEVWQKLEAMVSSEHDENERLLYRLGVKLEELVQQIDDNEVDQAQVTKVREDLQIAEDQVSGVAEVELKIRSLQDRIAIARKVVVAQKVLDSDSVTSELQKCEIELSEMRTSLDGLVMKVGGVDSKIREARHNLVRFDGVCPVDTGKCSRTKDINKNTPKIEKSIITLEKKRSALMNETDDLKTVYNELDTKVSNLQEYELGRKQAQEVLDEHGPDYEDEEVLARELASRRVSSEVGQDTRQLVQELRQQLSSLQASDEIYARAMIARRRTGEEVNELEKELSILRYIRLVVGKTGIPSMQIENGVQELQAQANNILAQVGTDHRLAFSFQTELKKKASACHECGRPFDKGKKTCSGCGSDRGNEKSDQMSVMVTENGNEFEFGQDSGGGQDLLAIAVRIALARMLGATILATDEVCASLDQENLRTYLTMLRGLANLGFRQVFDVSHRPEVAEALDRNIIVTRYPDYSTVGWE